MMKPILNTLLVILIPLLWNCAFIQWSINTRDFVPVSEVKIPEKTLQFLDEIMNRNIEGEDHLTIIRVDSLEMKDWKNETDFGRRADNTLYVYEPDSLFVFYTDKQDMTILQNVYQYALAAIPDLTEVMGQYVYPYQVKGRKLPIYLCHDEGIYNDVCNSFVDDKKDYSWTYGICANQYCGTEVHPIGISLNYGCIQRLSKDPLKSLNATLWHEMNHYVYFQLIDLTSELTMHTWVYEGIAEYFASKIEPQTSSLSAKEEVYADENKLDSSFNPFLFNYSGGEIFYRYIENKYGENGVVDFIKMMYNTPLEQTLSTMGLELDIAERDWKKYLKDNYISQTTM